MSITDIVTGQKKLSEAEVEGIIRNNAVHLSNIDSNLNQTLPSLIDHVLVLARERKQTYKLSRSYPQWLSTRDGNATIEYRISYICDKNGISVVAFDPQSNAMDPGESYIKQIPTKELLEWVRKDGIHMMDVYQHIKKALEQKKSSGEAHERCSGNYF